MQLLRDCQYAFRLLRKSPVFALVAVVALALGIGANTAIFSVVNSILLRPLPYRDSARLVMIWERNAARGWERVPVSGSNYLDWKEQSRTFEDMAAVERGTGTLTGIGEPMQFAGMRVTANFFDMLGVTAAMGRTFLPEEGSPGRHNVAVITSVLWQRVFGGDPSIVGRKSIVDGLPYTCIGVLPANFWTPIPAEGMVPWPEDELRRWARDAHELVIIGKLKPGVTPDQAQADLNAIERRIADRYPALQGWETQVVPMKDSVVSAIRPALLVLLAAVGFVLLIACANLANMLLARGAARARETAVRAALGARQQRLVRQFLTENLLLALAGGVCGLLVALWAVDLLEAIVPRNIGAGGADIIRPPIAIDAAVLLFTFLVSLATGLIFGLAPALAASRANLAEILKEGGRSMSSPGRSLRGGLVVAEIALALVLLVCAGLTIKSFWRMRHVDPGFRTDHALAMEMELPTDSKYRTGQEQVAFFREVLRRVRAVPGVKSAGLTGVLPLEALDNRTLVLVEGAAPRPDNQRLPADARVVSENYFTAMGSPVVAGRAFSAHDRSDRPPVVIVDETFVRRYLTPEGVTNPIGRRLRFTRSVREIVGVVPPVRHAGLDQPPYPTVYVPLEQVPDFRMTLVTRTEGDPRALIRAVKNAIYSVDAGQPVYNVRTLEELIDQRMAAARLTIALLSAFALAALFLASLGIYGVMSYTVAQRTHEVGIRMALGAAGRDVLALLLRQGLAMTALGVGVGLAGALAGTRLLASLLYGVSASDPQVLALTAILLAAVALAATWLPARRATRVDPILSLRYE